MIRVLRPAWLLLLLSCTGVAACDDREDRRERLVTTGAGHGGEAGGPDLLTSGAGAATGGDAEQAGAAGAPWCGDAVDVNAWASWPLSPVPEGQPAFTLRDETALDARTGLEWQRRLAAEPLTWSEAKQYCDCLELAGHDDWALPSRMELVSIVEPTRQNPAIDERAFPETPLEWFWSASPVAEHEQQYWYVAFFDGDTHSASADQRYWARCVRHQAGTTPRYDIATQTVRDAATGLTWQREASVARVTWPEAAAGCASLELDGGGWRLPDMKELQSLIDESRVAPAIDLEAFPATPSEGFWAGTPLAGVAGSAWFVSFDEGIAYNAVHAHPYRFRCVR